MEIAYKPSLNANALKIIAVTAMVIDHTTFWLVPSNTALYVILRMFGRLAAPIMCYLISEGYFHTSNKKKYLKRLFIFALISHYPYILYFNLTSFQATSIIWGLFAGFLALSISQSKVMPLGLKVFFILLCCLISWTADWNYISVLWILAFGLFRNNFSRQVASFILIGMLFYVLPDFSIFETTSIFRLGILLALPLFTIYDGTLGKKSFLMKWSFYIIYPGHLLILYVLRYYIF
ncbi:conjugal transfer protein TraX [Tetragenococcus halophilus subsp. flandriensis]|uniref:TraX family protein n=1 Tax=Tetragenococcus halophilus TaxID=51669 RepID=UPI0023E90E8B|nr:TraX family protein [Tetragenococcus halophilus]GMA08532.1 conjugal transfer protein TraX [Tetragenococcus halophilus subsp. flandriensis]